MKLTGQKSKAVNKDYTHLGMVKLSSAMQKLPVLELTSSSLLSFSSMPAKCVARFLNLVLPNSFSTFSTLSM
jgi:hypothetical protein